MFLNKRYIIYLNGKESAFKAEISVFQFATPLFKIDCLYLSMNRYITV